jgi:hypothetical protein
MVNMTLAIPEELHKAMRHHVEVKWSEIARRALWDYARKLELMERLVAKSKLTHASAEQIGEKIKAGLYRRLYREART